MNDHESRVRTYSTAAEFEDFDQSPDEKNAEKAREILYGDMDVLSVSMPQDEFTGINLHGRLLKPSHEVFGNWVGKFAELGLLPFLSPSREATSTDRERVDLALLKAPTKPRQSSPWVNLGLFLATCLSTLFVGSWFERAAPSSPQQLWDFMGLLKGWPFAATLLLILGTHEMGHFLVARHHRIPVSLPYFIPVPISFGTLGAFIRLRAPIWDRRKLFDVGVAGPLAGLVVAVPLLVIGLQTAELTTWSGRVDLEGNSIVYLLAKYWTFGAWLPNFNTGQDVIMNQVTFAAWIGLLATGLNLLPIGSLDGGHVVFALFGVGARPIYRAGLLLLAMLGLAGLSPLQELWEPLKHIGYVGWLIWLWFIILTIGPSHSTTLDMVTELDSVRRWIGYGMLFLFIMTFVPVPFRTFFY